MDIKQIFSNLSNNITARHRVQAEKPTCEHDWMTGRIDKRWKTCRKCKKQTFNGEELNPPDKERFK